MDRPQRITVSVTDADMQSFFTWAERERAIRHQLQRGKLGYGEFLLRRQMNYDDLVRGTTSDAAQHRDANG